MMNCFCGMVDRWKAFSLISSPDHCQKFSPLRISDTPQAGFGPAQNLSSGLLEWSCAVVITTIWWANSTPLIVDSCFKGFSFHTFTKEFFIALFCLSTKPLDCGWQAFVTHWWTPLRRWSSLDISLTNSLSWSLISIAKEPCLHTIFYKNRATAGAVLSVICFASDHLLK